MKKGNVLIVAFCLLTTIGFSQAKFGIKRRYELQLCG